MNFFHPETCDDHVILSVSGIASIVLLAVVIAT